MKVSVGGASVKVCEGVSVSVGISVRVGIGVAVKRGVRLMIGASVAVAGNGSTVAALPSQAAINTPVAAATAARTGRDFKLFISVLAQNFSSEWAKLSLIHPQAPVRITTNGWRRKDD